ncbi:hypothetical protein LTS15_004961 [Exophiala xenobiotica]|nr:hypothetical protein LTS15_004961 [Exophiala xenobiotica]
MSAATSPTRRVLGEKDVNALLSPKKTKAATELVSPRPSKRLASSIVSPRAGQKRKIAEVHNEEVGDSQKTNTSHTLSQGTEVSTDGPLVHHETVRTSTAAQANPTIYTSFHASQEEPVQLEESEFEILDEPSQQTLDKMHAVTFTQSTSQLVPPLRPNLSKEPSQVSLDMYSLIDFESLSSQGDDMQMLEEREAVVVKDQRPKTEEDTRKEMLLEKAEMLRTRLQLALYKIQTNQISMPFSRLTVPKAKSSSPDLPGPSSSSSPKSSSTLRPSSSFQRPSTTTITLTPESTVAVARARATMDPNKPTIKPLSSFPIPTIEPTAFSARWNDDDRQDSQESSRVPVPHIPSSPPMSEDDEEEDDLDNVDDLHDRPGGQNQAPIEPRTPVQLSSPAGTHQRRGSESENLRDLQNSNSQLRLRRGLTSSVIKGEAANSLLQLVRGGGGGGVATSSGLGMCGL